MLRFLTERLWLMGKPIFNIKTKYGALLGKQFTRREDFKLSFKHWSCTCSQRKSTGKKSYRAISCNDSAKSSELNLKYNIMSFKCANSIQPLFRFI
eukprot:snap_masked-scaffold_25-processed-gene-0.9-mRNA-1 protein AED:1.00 eAED:1.00 QI:0/0/0/0/1/1/2/0/95